MKYLAIEINVLKRTLERTDWVFKELKDHQFDSPATSNHIMKLIKLIANYYTKIRCHHLAKEETFKMMGKSVRHHNTKMTIFSGQ